MQILGDKLRGHEAYALVRRKDRDNVIDDKDAKTTKKNPRGGVFPKCSDS